MRILYVLKHDPWGIGGGCYACRNYFDAFSDIFNDAQFDILYCAEFKTIGEHRCERWHFESVPPLTMWNKLKSPFTGIMDRFHFRIKELLNNKQYDYCIFDHSSIAGPIVAYCRKKNVKTIVVNHNFEHDYYRDSHPQLYKRVFVLPSVKKTERNSYLYADINIFLTREDAELFEQTYGRSNTKVIVGGCFEQKGQPEVPGIIVSGADDAEKNTGIRLVVTGTLGNVQNMDGIDYFLNNLYPLLPKDMQVVIAGKNPPSDLIERIKGNVKQKQTTSIQSIYQAYHNNQPQTVMNGNITLLANPKDIQQVVASCDIYLCPMRLGGGLKLRVMDGFRNGLPVICHQVSARGYHAFIDNGFCVSYSNENEFLAAINSLCKSICQNNINKRAVMHFFSEMMGYEGRVNYLKDKILQK